MSPAVSRIVCNYKNVGSWEYPNPCFRQCKKILEMCNSDSYS